jgi:hypothetical protein
MNGCTFAPAVVTPGTEGATATLTLTTRGRTDTTVITAIGCVLLLAWAATGPFDRRRRPTAALSRTAAAALVIAMILGPACEPGPRPGPTPGGPAPTPSPTAVSTTVVVRGVSGDIEHRTVVTVIAQ